MGLNLDGIRDVLGIWVGPSGGEGANQWMTMLTDLSNRGIMHHVLRRAQRVPRGDRVDLAVGCGADLRGASGAQLTALLVHWQKISSQLRTIYTALTIGGGRVPVRGVRRGLAGEVPAMINLC